MEKVKFDCDCDLVIEMEEMGVGVEEILQYVKGVFAKEDMVSLLRGLEEIAGMNGDVED